MATQIWLLVLMRKTDGTEYLMIYEQTGFAAETGKLEFVKLMEE